MRAYSLHMMRNLELSTFRRFQSTPEHLEIRDPDGNLLAYRLRIPEFLVEGVQDRDLELPKHYNQKADRGGEFPIRHYATWADSSLDVFHSQEYQQDQPASSTCIQQNKSLCRYLQDRLSLIHPEAYNKLTNIVLPECLELLWHPWAGVPIQQPMNTECNLQKH